MLELAGIQGMAWRPLSGSQVLQIYPPTKTKGRKALREGQYLVVKSATSEWRYHDPSGNLKPNQWSYVGGDCSGLPRQQVWGWIKQAYEYLRHDKAAHVQGGAALNSRRFHTDAEVEELDTVAARIVVVGTQSAYESVGGKRIDHLVWLDLLMRALQQVPKGSQGKKANDLLAEALAQANLRFQREVAMGPGSGHSADFVIEYEGDRIGVEFGTGQAERVELDLLKLVNLALSRKITCACLILPQDLVRHKTMGQQPMKTAVASLLSMCSPLLTMLREYLKGLRIIWYV